METEVRKPNEDEREKYHRIATMVNMLMDAEFGEGSKFVLLPLIKEDDEGSNVRASLITNMPEEEATFHVGILAKTLIEKQMSDNDLEELINTKPSEFFNA